MNVHLFEVSWEVCNKVGGIHTVISSKAPTLVERYGDRYICIGPWIQRESPADEAFDEEPGFDEFRALLEAQGCAVRVGRWRIAGRPRTILVDFSKLFAEKNDLLRDLWERYHVDSLRGGWEYVEPAMFGIAAGRVIEAYSNVFLAPHRDRAVAQFHEWMTGSGALHLKTTTPSIGTIFTTHATVLGRALGAHGVLAVDGIPDETPRDAAQRINVPAKHSLEAKVATHVDVFTTVSTLTAEEATHALERRPNPVCPNGIDVAVMEELSTAAPEDEVRRRLAQIATAVTGEDPGDACFLTTSGRYEPHNKGIDVLLASLAKLGETEGRGVVCFLLVPAGNAGLRADLRDRLAGRAEADGPLRGVATHSLFDPETDPIHADCVRLGLDNAPGSRVKVIHVPVYLDGADGLLDLPYETVLRAMDLSAYPSYYEPWGYTPVESVAVGVPTITTDCAGFGVWAQEADLGPEDGVTVLARRGFDDDDVTEDLAAAIGRLAEHGKDAEGTSSAARQTAERLGWAELIEAYVVAYNAALRVARTRVDDEALAQLLPPMQQTPAQTDASGRLLQIDVTATLPERLGALERLASNLWWCWDEDAPALFEELASTTWRQCGRNPRLMLRHAATADLEARAADDAYVARLDAAAARFDAYMAGAPEERELAPDVRVSAKHPVAYFCFEYGLHESLPLYGGGLGILAGDHLKQASDDGLPLVGVGLLFREGYVHQRVSPSGHQIGGRIEVDPRSASMELVRRPDGTPMEVTVYLPSFALRMRAWRVPVGRVSLYLLDADFEGNHPDARNITRRLYSGDREHRLQQEIALGKGGVRLLSALGIQPSVLHLNEGHAAFAALERVAHLVRGEHLTFEEARAYVRATTAFTSHTPVPAGHDVFDDDLMRRYFADSARWIGLPWESFMRLGQSRDTRDRFNMTWLAVRMASWIGGVSRRHGEVVRKQLHPCLPDLLEAELPFGYVTNGVHLPTWTAPEIRSALAAVDDDPSALGDAELWHARAWPRERLLVEARRRLNDGADQRRTDPLVLRRMLEGLDPNALLLGFARRFAPYKRADLLFRDPDRLAALLDDPDRPVRLFIAGKAHPEDGAGLDLLHRVVSHAWSDRFLGKVFFLEDYDIELGRALVQGCDVWLNTPIPPLEASGTSGMKAAGNGGLNCSVLDGWWVEGYDGTNGWVVGDAMPNSDADVRDALDSAHLLSVLERHVVPAFFERDSEGLPTAWIERMRRAIGTARGGFGTDRMLSDYVEGAYTPLTANARDLAGSGFRATRDVSARQQRIARGFEQIEILDAEAGARRALRAGDHLDVSVRVRLAGLEPDEVQVEIVSGLTQSPEALEALTVHPLAVTKQNGDGVFLYEGSWPADASGRYGVGVRVRPALDERFDSSLKPIVRWAELATEPDDA
ncbi:MAG: alpha-glucan family phosphorylase [Planctomycetota bacterium]|nr:alpha-glucan family phosphorylase [Planctomycetota bacterium]